MIFFYIFAIYCFLFVKSNILHTSIQRGIYTTHVIYDSNNINNLNYILVKKDNFNLWIVGVINGVSNNVVCRHSLRTQIIISPRGCDSISEKNSVLRTNCGHRTPASLQLYWHADRNNILCQQLGFSASCFGHPYLVSTGLKYNPDIDDDFSLMDGVVVFAGYGPSCAIPTVTKINVQLTSLYLNMNCSMFPSGLYIPSLYEKNIFEYFAYKLYFDKAVVKGYLIQTLVFSTNFIDFNNLHILNNQSCSFTIVKSIPDSPLLLNSLTSKTYANYYKLTAKDSFYHTSICNIGVGRKSFDNGLSIIKGVGEGVPYGGIPILRNKQGIPYYIKPNKLYEDFDSNCNRFYPVSDTFHGFGFSGFDGPLYDRFVSASMSCYAPFPYPENIISIGTIEERAKQCFMMGGYLATDTNDVCSFDIWKTYCKKGWLYFDERCYYKYNTIFDSAKQAPAGTESEKICEILNPKATSVTKITYATKAWLTRFFVFYGDQHITIRMVLSGNQCQCFSSTHGVESCNCDLLNYPLCSYHHKDVEIPWASIAMHPQTIEILRDGQNGIPQDLEEIQCDCFAGSTGKGCIKKTCVPPIVIASTLNESLSNPLLSFFKKCYTHKKGYCNNDDPNTCICIQGYAPPASLTTSSSFHRDIVCKCPSAVDNNEFINKTVSVNGIIYNDIYPYCTNSQHGDCIIQPYIDGFCRCSKRNYGAVEEIAYNGKACSCVVAYKDDPMHICNGHGTCCPHNERNQMTSYSECKQNYNGCFCDDGWTGTACTARVPKSIEHKTYIDNGFNMYSTTLAHRIFKVYVNGKNISTVLLLGTRFTMNCIQINKDSWESMYDYKYYCGGNIGYNVAVYGSDIENVYLYNLDFNPGGYYVNKFNPLFFRDQPFMFAKYGVTIDKVYCAPGYSGKYCALPSSSIQFDQDVVCGESTEPIRGKANVNSLTCDCNSIGPDIHFTGSACQCAIVDSKMCFDKGRCLEPHFYHGFCQDDISLYYQDSLYTPYMYPTFQINKTKAYCSNPILRLIDDHVTSRRCNNEPIKKTNYTLGIGYGLFLNYTKGIDFQQTWTDAHYRLLGSVINPCDLDFNYQVWDGFWAGVSQTFEILKTSITTNDYVTNVNILDTNVSYPILIDNCDYIETQNKQIYCTNIGNVTDDNGKLISNIEWTVLNTSIFNYINVQGIIPINYNCSKSVSTDVIQQQYTSYFAQKRCSSNEQCECVDLNTATIPWLNGPSKGSVGLEGGCKCQSNYNPFTFCSTCVPGYGPNNKKDVDDFLIFANLVPNLSNTMDLPFCMVPMEENLPVRYTRLCGSRGYIHIDNTIRNVTYEMSIHTDEYNIKTIAKCEFLIYNSLRYKLLNQDFLIMTYKNNQSYINIIDNVIYINGTSISKEDVWCVQYKGQFESKDDYRLFYEYPL